mgnify:CR=1 FL=1
MIRFNVCVAVAVLSVATSSFAGTPNTLGLTLTFPGTVSIGTAADLVMHLQRYAATVSVAAAKASQLLSEAV